MVKLIYKIAAGKIRRDSSTNDKKRDAGRKTPDDIVRYDNILYGDDVKWKKWQLLDVYRPRSAVSDSGELKALPVIVIVHGGAWVYGDKDVYQFYAMNLAQRGFAVVNYSYRLAPEVRFPASLEDTEKVFEWICNKASVYGFDTQNVFAAGDSAGGHLLGLYASALSNPDYGANFPFIRNKNLVLRGLALNCGKYRMHADLDTNPQLRLLLNAFMPQGGSLDELKLIDASAHVTNNFPPTFVMTCRGDFLLSEAAFMKEALENAEVRHEFRCYGTEEEPLWHVFHCTIDLPQAVLCNDEECAFFKSCMA